MNAEQLAAYRALSAKRLALSAYAQALVLQETDANRATLDPQVQRTDLEINLVSATISDILNNAPMAFPAQSDLDNIRTLAAQLQASVDNSAAVAKLISDGDALISAWPTLS